MAPPAPSPPSSGDAPADVDGVATRAARERLQRVLSELAKSPRFALGHQDTTAYGVGWSGDADRSDLASLCGSHAAVRGWDLFGIERDAPSNGDGVDFERMRALILDAHRRGAVNTVSWHVDNPVSGKNAWDRTRAVHAILPGQRLHTAFLGYLDRVARFMRSLRAAGGELVPIIFRPFHEHTGSWFWWGGSNTNAADFVSLWRFTVDYLRNEQGLDNLLIAFSPDGGQLRRAADYFYRYPGDAYVDVFGVDQYYARDSRSLVRAVEIAVRAAEARGKIPALTEFGARDGLNSKGIGPRWMVDDFLRPLEQSAIGSRIAYALAWRNASTKHCFMPYPGYAGAELFRGTFCADDRVLLEKDISSLLSSP